MSVTSTYPTLLDEFFSIADNPAMNEPGRTALDVIAELQSAVAAVQSSLGITGALNYMRATGSVAQTVSGNKTFTGITALRNGSASGGLVVGAEVNASTLADNTRKLFQVALSNYANAQLPYCVLRADSNSTAASTALDIGGTNTASAHGFPNVRIWTSPDINQAAVLRWFFNAVGGFQPASSGAYDIGGPTARVRDLFGLSADLSGNVVSAGVFVGNGSGGARLQPATADGSDTQECYLSGGGAAGTARGAYVRAQGNEHPTRPGRLELYGGAVAGGAVVVGSNMGLGGQSAPGCPIDNAGSSKLGPLAPGIRYREYTGTFGSAGVLVAVPHGLADHTKIVFSQGHFNHANGERWQFTSNFAVSLVANSVDLRMVPDTSAAGRTFSVLIGVKD